MNAVPRTPFAVFLLLAGIASAPVQTAAETLTNREKSALIRLARTAGQRHFRPSTIKLGAIGQLKRVDALSAPVSVVLRHEAILRGAGSADGGKVTANLLEAVRLALNDNRYGQPLTRSEFARARIEVFILGEGERINESDPNIIRNKYVYGHDSLRIERGKKSATMLNFMAMENGWSTPTLLDNLCQQAALQEKTPADSKAGTLAKRVLSSDDTRLYRVPTIHLLESAPRDEVIHLYRCSVDVPTSSVDIRSVTQAVHDGGDWLLRSMHWNGEMDYLWQARSGTLSSKNMQLRQWMATIALWDLFQFSGEEKYRTAARKNMTFNLKTGWNEEPKKGIAYINKGGATAFLGAAAFALTGVQKIGSLKKYDREVSLLRNFILNSQREDGGLEPHYPKEKKTLAQRQKSERYYSGEALLALLRLYEETGQKELIDAARKAFPYQVKFFERDRHPAAVPWLTQAYYRAWLVEKKQEYVDFIFKLSDFLLLMQNVDGKPTPDLLGEFYDPNHPEYGPSNVASTGVYVEGLVDAYRLARAVGDNKRAEAYRRSIILGIRNLIHLQFKPDNLFYLKFPDRTRGGMRGTVTSHAIRIDYVQHAVQAMIQALDAIESWSIDTRGIVRP